MPQNSNPLTKNIPILDIDPNVVQHQASMPDHSVWVNASAGSGKTKVLTDRILRLLLPNSQGFAATPPQKILALTYTKAGANEMALRVQSKLSEWAVMSNDNLIKTLHTLLKSPPSDHQINSARSLFAQVVDVPGGLKIMTIHSFCQSILGRFPLEANLTPGFKPLEEHQAKIYLKQAQDKTLQNASQNDPTSPMHKALHNLVLIHNEEQFEDILKKLLSEQRQLSRLLKTFGVEGLYQNICDALNIKTGQTIDDIKRDTLAKIALNEDKLWLACTHLSEGTNTDINRADRLQKWLELSKEDKFSNFNDYKTLYIKKDETAIYAKLATKKIADTYPDTIDFLKTEATQLWDMIQKYKAISTANITHDLFLMGDAILSEYSIIKRLNNALDFDDLILYTLDLLKGETDKMKGLAVSPWVRYKLDQGIDHILVDEAQDTNPEQWEIIKALTDDFFNGDTAHENERTLFVVGDQKQSIFGFQRASPKKFNEMRQWFDEKITQANKVFNPINFIVSFRSTVPILELVDTVFNTPETRKGLENDIITHQSFRPKQAGLVELWPLFEAPETQTKDAWTLPITLTENTSSSANMADYIGQQINNWVGKEYLESENRTIKAGDIMILVKSRNMFIDQLVRALKKYKIPVSGVDRMIISDQLVVEDICAAAQFGLLPEDDLTLSCLLKSPFIGWDEQQLFDVCYNRAGKSLWQVVQTSKQEKTIKWLKQLITTAGKERPYEFFSFILQTPCPAHDISGLQALKGRLGDDCLEPLNEFLNNAIKFESDNIATLQSFTHAQLQDKTKIKREMEETEDAVRIMTVHGSKGLQAPIVILPDTVKPANSNKPERILWPDKTDASVPYFCPSTNTIPDKCHGYFQDLKEREEEEYRRLLYVALTRAEDKLYIGGYESRRKIPDNCWYKLVEAAFDSLENTQEIEENGIIVKRYYKPSTDVKNKNSIEKTTHDIATEETPSWLFQDATEESLPPRPLTPSRPSESESAALSPLQSQNDDRFKRGNITHKLLQILPDLDAQNWKKHAQLYVAHPAHDLSQKRQDSIVSETLNVLHHPEFKDIFGPNSSAEVSITGKLDDNRIISGQIDRLVVTPHTVYIIDFKTNRPPPKDEKNIPQIYRNQMKAYADAIRKIYPSHDIKSALLWTDGANLMELSDI